MCIRSCNSCQLHAAALRTLVLEAGNSAGLRWERAPSGYRTKRQKKQMQPLRQAQIACDGNGIARLSCQEHPVADRQQAVRWLPQARGPARDGCALPLLVQTYLHCVDASNRGMKGVSFCLRVCVNRPFSSGWGDQSLGMLQRGPERAEDVPLTVHTTQGSSRDPLCPSRCSGGVTAGL